MIHATAALVLLDVEGTVSPLAYVHEVLFPYARQAMGSFLERNPTTPAVQKALAQMARDAGQADFAAWCPFPQGSPEAASWAAGEAARLMDADAKTTGLKLLQGLIWEEGFHAGVLRSQVFADVAPAFRAWTAGGLALRIYSSGSVHAQRLFFSHTEAGDLAPAISGYYDTVIGPKRDPRSYEAIAAHAGCPGEAVLFLSDIPQELDAARQAGFQTALAVRPGNPPCSDTQHPRFTSLGEIAVHAPTAAWP